RTLTRAARRSRCQVGRTHLPCRSPTVESEKHPASRGESSVALSPSHCWLRCSRAHLALSNREQEREAPAALKPGAPYGSSSPVTHKRVALSRATAIPRNNYSW